MSVPGPENGTMPSGEADQRLRGIEGLRVQGQERITEVKPKVDRDLVVPRPAGVDAEPDVAEPAGKPELDRGVNVLVLVADLKPTGPVGRERGAEGADPLTTLP